MKREGKYYVNNHILINLQYHVDPDEFEGFRVVSFEVYPQNLVQKTKQGQAGQVAACDGEVDEQNFFVLDPYPSISYTYDVAWTPSQLRWASRWDTYLKMHEGRMHWFSIVNSLMIVLFLSCMVAMILLHPPPWHCRVQRRVGGGHGRGDGLEARARRRLS